MNHKNLHTRINNIHLKIFSPIAYISPSFASFEMFGFNVDEVAMNNLNNYMENQPYKISKEFYEGVSENNETSPKSWKITKKSIALYLNQIRKEPMINTFLLFSDGYEKLLDQEKISDDNIDTAAMKNIQLEAEKLLSNDSAESVD